MKTAMTTETTSAQAERRRLRDALLTRAESAALPLPPKPARLPLEDYEKRQMAKDAVAAEARCKSQEV